MSRRAPGGARVTGDGTRSVQTKLEASVAAGDYYSALQMYKTLYSRKNARNRHAEAEELLVDGTLIMLKYDQLPAANELGSMLMARWVAKDTEASDYTAGVLGRINDAFPPGKEHAAFLLAALKWSKHAGSLPGGDKDVAVRGDPGLHFLAARALEAADDLAGASTHYLHSEKPVAFAKMVVKWSDSGYTGERDLFMARAVLQLCCLGNLRDANIFRVTYLREMKSKRVDVDTPLAHFVEFLLLTLERDAESLFKVLVDKYKPSLSRDPSLTVYVQQIGGVFYGIKPPTSGMEALMGSMMSMLGGGGGSGSGAPGGMGGMQGLMSALAGGRGGAGRR